MVKAVCAGDYLILIKFKWRRDFRNNTFRDNIINLKADRHIKTESYLTFQNVAT